MLIFLKLHSSEVDFPRQINQLALTHFPLDYVTLSKENLTEEIHAIKTFYPNQRKTKKKRNNGGKKRVYRK